MNYTVSVRLMTYMHAPFIREAMDGIMQQKINFLVEVVVGDDFSTDGTLDIIKEYANTENIHIKILEREIGDDYWEKRQKQGRLYNFKNIIENCSGKYIALLDGDDYWTDPLKLQKQVDFLEANIDYSAITTDTLYLKEGVIKNNYVESKENWLRVKFPPVLTYKDITARLYPHTTTWLFRNVIREFPESFFGFFVADMPLFLMLADKGKVKYINEIISVYRLHDSGAIGKLKKNTPLDNLAYYFDLLIGMNMFFGKKYTKETEYALLQESYRFLEEDPVFKNISTVKVILKKY